MEKLDLSKHKELADYFVKVITTLNKLNFKQERLGWHLSMLFDKYFELREEPKSFIEIEDCFKEVFGK